MAVEDAIGCLAAGDCIVMTKMAFYASIGLYILGGLAIAALVGIAFFTPAMTFLKAKIRKATITYMVNRSQGGRFFIGWPEQGILNLKNVGPVLMTENSHTIEHKSGLPLFITFGEFAATLPLKWVYVLNKLRKRALDEGKPLTDVEKLGARINLKFDDKTKSWVKS